MLDDTDLQIAKIAYRAGCESLRRCNAAVIDLYDRPPSDVRRRASRASGQAGRSANAHG